MVVDPKGDKNIRVRGAYGSCVVVGSIDTTVGESDIVNHVGDLARRELLFDESFHEIAETRGLLVTPVPVGAGGRLNEPLSIVGRSLVEPGTSKPGSRGSREEHRQESATVTAAFGQPVITPGNVEGLLKRTCRLMRDRCRGVVLMAVRDRAIVSTAVRESEMGRQHGEHDRFQRHNK
jgi:hypothetical protein